MSIFSEYYKNEDFKDRYKADKDISIDVIIPTINTNELWYTNLLSFYREIPINKLLIGDGGSTDDTIKIAEEFPRVKILEQSSYDSQGYAIKDLILNVETDYFIYLHADVYLPKGWFDAMYKYRKEYDWYECMRKMTVLFEYTSWQQHKAERAYSGSQFGRTSLIQKSIRDTIDDDYLQRNEDIIFMELIREAGGKYAKIEDTFHYHQVMNKQDEQEPDLDSVSIIKKSDPEWEKRIFIMQYKGIIKYLKPQEYLAQNIFNAILQLDKGNNFNWKEFRHWVRETNPYWLPLLKRNKYFAYQMKKVAAGFKSTILENTTISKHFN